MKVYQEGPIFEPINIIIETEEEAITLWHRLNYGGVSTLVDYKLHKCKFKDEHNDMFMAFNKVFTPDNQSY